MYVDTLEPDSTKESTNRTIRILDANYEKANLPKIVQDNCTHLTLDKRNKLLRLLLSYENLFDGTLGDWQTEPVKFELNADARPYHGKAFPVPMIYMDTLKKEVSRLVALGVLERQPDSEWGAPTFIIPKKNLYVLIWF